jgi:hypothetical protein
VAAAELAVRRRRRRIEKIADAGGIGAERIAIGGVMALEGRGLVDDEEGQRLLAEYGARLGAALDADILVGIGKDDDEPRRAGRAQLRVGLLRDRRLPLLAEGAVAAQLLAGARRGGDHRP